MSIDLWFAENYTSDAKFSIRIKEHLYSKESPFQQIDMFDTYEFGRLFVLDGVIMTTEKDEFVYHDMISHVPMAVNPNIKRVLVIGGGDGGTVRELTKYDIIEKIDMVEIDELVVKAARKYLPTTSCKLDDPRVSLYFQDGIEFVRNIEEKYDLIIVDSTDPIGPGEGLFTQEFYDNCYKGLSEEGILINQNESAMYDHTKRELQRAYKKIKETFPIAEVYQYHNATYAGGHWLFGFASKKYHPLKDFDANKWNALALDTKYYNTDLHLGAFYKPNYIKKALEEALK